MPRLASTRYTAAQCGWDQTKPDAKAGQSHPRDDFTASEILPRAAP